MKYFLLIFIVILMFSTSCKKDYICECKGEVEYEDDSSFVSSTSITFEESEQFKERKKNAETKCSNKENQLKTEYIDENTTSSSIVCVLK